MKMITASGNDLKEILDDAQHQYQAGLVEPTEVTRAEIVVYDENGNPCAERDL